MSREKDNETEREIRRAVRSHLARWYSDFLARKLLTRVGLVRCSCRYVAALCRAVLLPGARLLKTKIFGKNDRNCSKIAAEIFELTSLVFLLGRIPKCRDAGRISRRVP